MAILSDIGENGEKGDHNCLQFQIAQGSAKLNRHLVPDRSQFWIPGDREYHYNSLPSNRTLSGSISSAAMERTAENLLVGKGKACYVWPAFVALVTPLDSFEGAASSNLRPLSLYGWRRSRSTNSLKKKSEYISERTRNSEVVQCQQGVRVHSAPVRRGCFRTLLGHPGGRIQNAQRRTGG